MQENWTIESIKAGFDKFFEENGRLPTSPEVDVLEYLPSSRQIQRKFGGLEKLRTLLGYEDVHFGKGKYRSAIAISSNKNGRNAEISLEKLLRDKFQEVFVHTERIFDSSKNRVDFYVYSPSGDFGIDVFQTQTMRDLQKNINIKIDKYKNFNKELYFVVANPDFEQEDIDLCVSKKKKDMPEHTQIVSMKKLIEIVNTKKSYPNPLM
jgi:hypothetical protein